MEPLDHAPEVTELELEELPTLLNVGPSHPTTHGTVRLVLELSGETAHPYLKYGEVDFDVPVGTDGDCLDRFQVRLEEIRQSARIVEQCLERIPPDGPMQLDDVRVVLPPKEEVFTTIEGTIQHFKIVMEGIKLPAGEVYAYTEASNGELGFYLVSDGSGTPARFHVRGPCFYTTAGIARMITGEMLADVVPCFGSVNMIGGECDR